MGGFAWVTLATNDSYSLGALVLAHSLKNAGTKQDLVVLVTPGVTNSMREKLSSVFNVVKEVNILDSKDETNLKLLKRPELGVTFTKLHCWRLTQYEKCVFLDADTMVLQNCDELFEREELSAAHDVGWPDCFNSGVFVFRPSNDTYDKLIQFALEKGSFDGGDQGLLNLYFSDWSTKDISKHLPFIYNMSSTACYSYLPAFKQFGSNAKILHFIAETKPWLQYFNTETREVQPSSESRHIKNILQKWWDIFCQLIHPNLTPDMARSSSDVRQTNQNQVSSYNSPEIIHTAHNINSPIPRSNTPKTDIWDPWESYIQEPNFAVPDPQVTEPNLKPIESHNTNACYFASHNIPPVSPEQSYEAPTVPTFFDEQTNTHQPPVRCDIVEVEPQQPRPQPPISSPELRAPSPPPAALPEPPLVVVDIVPDLNAPPHPVLSTECEAPPIVCTETTLHTPEGSKDEVEGGLAGAFAQLTLGSPRTAEQSALDDHLRRQGWEVGNIDYLGRDSFDNIWSKICETLSTAPPPEPAEESSTPVETSVKTTAATETTTSVEAPAPLPQETKPETPVAPTPAPSSPAKPEEVSAPQSPQIPAPAPAPPAAVPEAPVKPAEPPVATPEAAQPAAESKKPEPAPPATPAPVQQPETPPQEPPKPQQPEAGVAPETPQSPPRAEAVAPEAPQCPLKPKEPETVAPETPQCPVKPKEPEAVAAETPQCPLKPKEAEVAAPEAPQCPLKPKEAEAAAAETPQCALKPKEAEVAALETPQCPLKPEAADPETPQCPLKPKEAEAAVSETPQCALKPKEPEAVAVETPQCPLKPKEAEVAPLQTVKDAESTTPEASPLKPKETEAAPAQETPKKPEEQQSAAPAAAAPSSQEVAKKSEEQPAKAAPATPEVAKKFEEQPAKAAPPAPEVPATPEVTPATPELAPAPVPAPELAPVAPPSAPQEPKVAEAPSPQPVQPGAAAAATPESPKPKKEEEQPKQAPETTSTPQPTPPPRKGSGGGKKGGKSKK